MESNKTSFKKICRKCGKELPLDSTFCQYCGRSDIDAISIVKVKVCRTCGKELPFDSMFCQYCGSQSVVEKEVNQKASVVGSKDSSPSKAVESTRPSKATNSQNSASKAVVIGNRSAASNNEIAKKTTLSTSVSSENTLKYKRSFIISCVVSGLLFICLIGGFLFENSIIEEYKNGIKIAEQQRDTYKEQKESLQRGAKNYNDIVYEARIPITNKGFFASSTVLYKPNKARVVFYVDTYGEYNVSWNIPLGVTIDYGNTADGLVYLDITYVGTETRVIEVTNDYNNETLKIYLIG